MAVIAMNQKAQCAWCKVVTRDGIEPITHGICADCAEKVKAGINPLRWDVPTGQGVTDDWRDAFIATQLADVMARRHYGIGFNALSVEDRNVIRGECESFVERQTYIQRKRAEQVPA